VGSLYSISYGGSRFPWLCCTFSLSCTVFDGVVRYVMTGATSDLTGLAGLCMGIIKSKLNGVQGSPLAAFLHLITLSVNDITGD
jgi:hypothetical protein